MPDETWNGDEDEISIMACAWELEDEVDWEGLMVLRSDNVHKDCLHSLSSESCLMASAGPLIIRVITSTATMLCA
jgi:hypothetical protein